jgi:hypothetical protein
MATSPDDVRMMIGGPKDRTPDDSILNAFIAEAQSRVEGAVGALTESDAEAWGIVRDFAAAMAIFMMRSGQSAEPPRMAEALENSAAARLRDLDARRSTTGVGEVEEDAWSPAETGNLFSTEDAGFVIDDSGRFWVLP